MSEQKMKKIKCSDDLELVFKYLNFIKFSHYFLFSDYELYDKENDTSVQLHTADEALKYLVDGKRIEDWLSEIEVTFDYSGGRGAKSGEMGGGFGHAQDGAGDEGEQKTLFPATFNRQGRFVNQDTAVKMFEQMYKNANVEYAISVDSQGFVHRHVQGAAHSVYIRAAGENHRIIHNHPSGGNFSDDDLLILAKDKKASGIDAIGNKRSYSVIKTKNFKAADFAKGVAKAKWPKKLSYDDGADWWLKRNASKYGYVYSARNTR